MGLRAVPKEIDRSRPVLVLLHGSGATNMMWNLQIRTLGKKINVLATELPGHGQTPGPALESIPSYAAWVIRLLEALDLPNPLYLCGASLGGAVALETGLERPDLLSGLILSCTGAHLEVDPDLIDSLRTDYAGAVKEFVKSIFHEQSDGQLIHQSIELLSAAPPEFLIGDLLAGHGCDRRDRLSEIDRPTLVVCGTEDSLTPPELSRFLADNITGACLKLVDGAGHMPMIEQGEKFNRLLLSFVSNGCESAPV